MSYEKSIEDCKERIIDCVPEHMKILVRGELDALLTNYNTKAIAALTNLKLAVPHQTKDQDWWSDELREAMEEADKLV